MEKAGLKDRLGDEYIGAKGSMLNCSKSVDFTELLDKNVVLELESIRSVGQKSFLMGMILSRYKNEPKEILDHAKSQHPRRRYACVNLTNVDTVEFRIFRGKTLGLWKLKA